MGYPPGTQKVSLKDDDWEQIVTVLAPGIAAAKKVLSLEKLRSDVELALQAYHIVKQNMADTSVAVVRQNLAQLHKLSTKLVGHMNQLDMNSRALLSEAGSTAFHQWFALIIELKNQSVRAEDIASDYPREGGRPKDYPMLNMANQLAMALSRHLGEEAITPNPLGLFGNTMSILLRIARGSEDEPEMSRITRAAYDFFRSCQDIN